MRIENVKLSLVESAGIFPVWMIFYVMGVLKAQGFEILLQNKHPLRYSILAIILCCVHIYLLYRIGATVTPGIKLSAFFMYLTHCLVLFTFSHLHIPDFWSLRWLLGIVLSTLMAYVCDKKCPARMRRYVGF